MDTIHHVFLSPHLDDAVLSCGGMIYQLARAGGVVQVITIFAGDPPSGPLSPFARSLHDRWQADYAVRRREDVESLALLGAEAIHWPFADCVYRRAAQSGAALYDSEDSLFGAVDEADAVLLSDISSRLAAIDIATRLYVPLAAGHHVDHQIVRAAAESLTRAVVHYEDYPYAEDPEKLAAALGGGAWKPELVRLDGDTLRVKTRAIWAHRSQMSTFFTSEADMEARISAYARLVGGGEGPAERVWRAAG